MTLKQFRLWRLAVALLVVALTGGGGTSPANGSSMVPAQTNGSDQTNSRPDVSLVPLDTDEFLFSMDIPKSWKTKSTDSQDLVTVAPPGQKFPRIEITTRKLGDVQAVSEEQEVAKLNRMGVKNPRVRTIRWPGARIAHEVMFDDERQSPRISVLGLWLYGSTYCTFVDFSAASDEFAKWEPTFRASLKTFVPGNLDAEPLPGHP